MQLNEFTILTKTKRVQVYPTMGNTVAIVVQKIGETENIEYYSFLETLELVEKLNSLRDTNFTTLMKFVRSYKSVVTPSQQSMDCGVAFPFTTPSHQSSDCGVVSSCPAPVPAPAKLAESGQGNPLFISVKATGHGHNDEIIDLAIVDINENILFQANFKTKTQNRVFANAHLADLPNNHKANFGDLWEKIEKTIRGKTIVTYHLPHVKKMIANSVRITFQSDKNLTFEQILPNQKFIGLMYDYSKFYGDFAMTGLPKNQSLDNACSQSDIFIDDLRKHCQRARHDAIKTARLYRYMQSKGLL